MPMAKVAGHDFRETPAGRRCTAYSPFHGRICMMPWLHVRSCRREDVGVTDGLAHYGKATAGEFEEIRAEVEREEILIWQAITDAASAGTV